MKQKGYTIIEALVYLAIAVVLAYSSSHIMLLISQALQREQRRIKQSYQELMALDLMAFDIWHASSSVEHWQLASDELIWHTQTCDMRWCVKNRRLIRKKGIFDVVLKQWNKKRSSIVCNNVDRIAFQYMINEGHVQSVHINLIHNNEMDDVQRTIYLRNRVIHEN